MPNPHIKEYATFSAIPSYVPVGVIVYTQDLGNLYIGTGISDNGGTPGVNPLGVQTATVKITQAQIISKTTVQILPAPGANLMIAPIFVTATYNLNGGAAFSSINGADTFEIALFNGSSLELGFTWPLTGFLDQVATTSTCYPWVLGGYQDGPQNTLTSFLANCSLVYITESTAIAGGTAGKNEIILTIQYQIVPTI